MERRAAQCVAAGESPGDFAEAAFRRGFHYGVLAVSEAVAPLLPPEARQSLRRYMWEVHDWRRNRE
jgi:hypothetical protein